MDIACTEAKKLKYIGHWFTDSKTWSNALGSLGYFFIQFNVHYFEMKMHLFLSNFVPI